jgi:hypothetical protein
MMKEWIETLGPIAFEDEMDIGLATLIRTEKISCW